jgi:hypothetical protein
MSCRECPTFARWRGRFRRDSRKKSTTETLRHREKLSKLYIHPRLASLFTYADSSFINMVFSVSLCPCGEIAL